MELVKLTDITLKSSIETKQANGTKTKSYIKVDDYKAWVQSLEDEVNSQIYGANIYKVFRIKTPRKDLENFLKSKVNNTSDNISKYYIFIADNIYKINDAKTSGITVERINDL